MTPAATLFRKAVFTAATASLWALSTAAHADFTLSYTGLPFDAFYSPDGVHSVAGTSLTAVITLAGTPDQHAGISTGADVLDWSLSTGSSDGGYTLSPAYGDVLTALSFRIENGQVKDWIVAAVSYAVAAPGICFYCTPGAELAQTVLSQGDASVVQSNASYSGVYESSVSTVGVWTLSAVPEPTATALWLLGLAGLAVAARRRPALARRQP